MPTACRNRPSASGRMSPAASSPMLGRPHGPDLGNETPPPDMTDHPDTSVSRRGSVELPSEPASAGRARAFVADMLAVWDCDDTEEVAGLLTSEVVTNAVRHAGGDLVLEVYLQAGTVRIATVDLGPMWTQPIP